MLSCIPSYVYIHIYVYMYVYIYIYVYIIYQVTKHNLKYLVSLIC